jgi:hypothetical protein
VSEADDTTNSGEVAEEAEGGSWRMEVEDDQRKLNRWVECAVEPNCLLAGEKNMAKSMRCDRKI